MKFFPLKISRHSSVVVITICFYSFLKACITPATRVTPKNEQKLLKEYKYDGLMFRDGLKCDTCNIIK